MSITGIRDMSTITTPPEERHPVLTYVGAYDEKQIGAAIRREVMRDGQCSSSTTAWRRSRRRLPGCASRPEARVVTAHGQMAEHTLEQVIADFWERAPPTFWFAPRSWRPAWTSPTRTRSSSTARTGSASLSCTSSGRVGRGRECAYAYFLYPPEIPLTEEAHEWLATIATHSASGAGMQVAMKDLEIRGAGNLLGGEQSGHIADVGFDLYVRLVGEAVTEYRGEGGPATPEVLQSCWSTPIYPTSTPSERLRLDAGRRLSEALTDADVDAAAEELDDRYGEPAPGAQPAGGRPVPGACARCSTW